MPRPLRLQYEGAFYHVMNRGRGRQRIFHGEAFYEAFLKTLKEASERFDARIHAYCLMRNHYHLLVETPRANLDRIMRHINGVYTQRYNRLKQTDGPLFRGRYKAIVVDADAYLLSLSRYIHRNPAEVKGASEVSLLSHPWSSYLAYINKTEPPPWLLRDNVLCRVAKRNRYQHYKAYVEAGTDEEIKQFYSKGNVAAILGDSAFRQGLKSKEDELKVNVELSQVLSERPSSDEIIQVVAEVFKVEPESIVHRQVGRPLENLPRKVAMYCCQTMGDVSLAEIAKTFGLRHSNSVSPAIHEIKSQISRGELSSELRIIEKQLYIIK